MSVKVGYIYTGISKIVPKTIHSDDEDMIQPQKYGTQASELVGINGKPVDNNQDKKWSYLQKNSDQFDIKFAPISDQNSNTKEANYGEGIRPRTLTDHEKMMHLEQYKNDSTANYRPINSNTNFSRMPTNGYQDSPARNMDGSRRNSFGYGPNNGYQPNVNQIQPPSRFGITPVNANNPYTINQNQGPMMPPGFLDFAQDDQMNSHLSPNAGNFNAFSQIPHQSQLPGYPLQRQNEAYGANNFAPSPVGGMQDTFQRMQMQYGNDPYFYRNMNFEGMSPQNRSPQKNKSMIVSQISDSVLRGLFNRYAINGSIDATTFPRLIDEIYSHERRQPPDYIMCLSLMSKYDTNGDGSLDYAEFKLMLNEL